MPRRTLSFAFKSSRVTDDIHNFQVIRENNNLKGLTKQSCTK